MSVLPEERMYFPMKPSEINLIGNNIWNNSFGGEVVSGITSGAETPWLNAVFSEVIYSLVLKHLLFYTTPNVSIMTLFFPQEKLVYSQQDIFLNTST